MDHTHIEDRYINDKFWSLFKGHSKIFLFILVHLVFKPSFISDPIMDSWPLFRSPFPVLSILAFYVIFVLYLGPKYMKQRKPYDLKWIIRVFNVCQIVHNIYMIIRGFMEPNYTSFLVTLGCHKVTKIEENIFLYNLYRGYWHYFLNKVLDLLDTGFFVLRKKQSHVTFLHVYHHTSMVIIIWTVGKYFPGKEGAFAGLINACIHVCMYIYYTIASFGDKFQGHLKYKRHLTLLQITQFLVILIYSIFSHYISCGHNLVVVKFIMIEAVINLVLFLNFYRKAYGIGRSMVRDNLTKMMICTPLQMKENLLDQNGNVVVKENGKETKVD